MVTTEDRICVSCFFTIGRYTIIISSPNMTTPISRNRYNNSGAYKKVREDRYTKKAAIIEPAIVIKS
jgi:hypothetical protein